MDHFALCVPSAVALNLELYRERVCQRTGNELRPFAACELCENVGGKSLVYKSYEDESMSPSGDSDILGGWCQAAYADFCPANRALGECAHRTHVLAEAPKTQSRVQWLSTRFQTQANFEGVSLPKAAHCRSCQAISRRSTVSWVRRTAFMS